MQSHYLMLSQQKSALFLSVMIGISLHDTKSKLGNLILTQNEEVHAGILKYISASGLFMPTGVLSLAARFGVTRPQSPML